MDIFWNICTSCKRTTWLLVRVAIYNYELNFGSDLKKKVCQLDFAMLNNIDSHY